MKLFSSAAPRVCLPTPTHSGPAWSPAPLPGAAQGQERCGNFPSDSAAGWLLLRSLAWHRHQAGWASFPAGPGPAQPRLTLCRLQGQEWVSGPSTLHPASDQGLVSRPPPPPAASAQACFLLSSCSLISFGFPSGWLPTLPKIPSRKFACCHKIMQICS